MHMIRPALDPDLLRTFVAIAEEGSFTRAGARVGRTQSAVSMQMQRLEGALNERLVARSKGGAVQLTPHGHFLLTRAREVLAMNDSIWSSFHTPALHGAIRLGTPDDYALRYVPDILKRFAETHPGVQVDVECLPSSHLVALLREGALDMTLCSDGHEPPGWPSTALWQGALTWITSTRYAPHRLDPLPVALAAAHCTWAAAAVRALEGAGRHYRVAYRSASQVGTHAPVLAGLAVTVGTFSWLPEGLRPIRADEGLPPLPQFGISLLRNPDAAGPATDALAGYILQMAQADARAAA